MLWNDTSKMLLRYVFAIAISYATAQGWITEATGGTISQVVEQLLGLLVAFTPAIYAAVKIDNGLVDPVWTPAPPKRKR